MSDYIDHLAATLADPVGLFGHFTYFLLIVSMLMRRMVWLRVLAVGSGLAKLVYRGFLLPDPVSVLWETIFVLVNLIQLLLIWYYEKYHRFDDDEKLFVESMPKDAERRALRRLLTIAMHRDVEEGVLLTEQGQPVQTLMFVTKGVVTIARDGAVFAACGPGDYVGEMSFLTGNMASATARTAKPVRLLTFDQARLRQAARTDAGIRRVLEGGLNSNLVDKLVRSHGPVAEGSAAGA